MLASRGFAVLGLPYYSPIQFPAGKAEIPELPANFVEIAVERLNDAYEWLKARPDVDATRIALHGTSKGAEFALIAGTEFSWIKAIVAPVPTDVVWEGWGNNVAPGTKSSFSLNGKALPFVPYLDFGEELKGFQTGTDVRFRRPQDRGRAAHPLAAVKARIPVEKFKGPLLVIGGQDDQVWASGMMAHNIAEKRAAHGLETVALIYSDAGHALSGHGFQPTTQLNAGPMKMGGTPEGNGRASGDACPKTIAFLKRTLGVQ
jgi:dienelactone hydrolase